MPHAQATKPAQRKAPLAPEESLHQSNGISKAKGTSFIYLIQTIM